ncbi:hypothetical protein P5G51_016320 [Virgibacillus sp. 179-BFC.A HS]|uniref:Uncharacterized protein n=1 Tax=Tigheibacillus jepli TaxID=3035914 RepID=A0ABU5CK44_9BACI|nr:hypothetical protein [Virgibacillus sp. 179-BFC.A HS]MDY0406716.1 hypothetical protein [Virgibacillus sp. 179-BFC.A HS]
MFQESSEELREFFPGFEPVPLSRVASALERALKVYKPGEVIKFSKPKTRVRTIGNAFTIVAAKTC